MRVSSLAFILILFYCCEQPQKPSEQGGKLIAEVYGEQLLDHEIKTLIPETANATDSINISVAYMEQWIRESLILHEAKKDVPPDIDKLVEDYRSSLLKVHFENNVIESNLDSLISETELKEFYDGHKSEYLLKEKAILIYLLKIKEDATLKSEIENLWEEDKLEDINKLVKSSDEALVFEERLWNKISELSKILSRKIVKRIERNEGNRFSTSEEGFKYFIKVIEIKSKNDIPPFSVMENQLRKVILHQRKNEILHRYTEDLYQQEVRKNSIKTYIES